MPKISIIVPIYKAEKYINRCLDSILAQTFTDWELLLVDDGSPDKSGDVCDEYAARDKRIRVFHKENGGVSSARQVGQNEATGEYTIHVDPDDWVEPNMLENLYAKAKVDNADIVICDYIMNIAQKVEYVIQKPKSLNPRSIIIELFQQLHGSCCNKLVRRVCYSGKVNFPIGINCCEDLIWCIQVILLCKKISYLPQAFYHYVVSKEESQSKTITRESFEQDKLMLRQLEKLLRNNHEALSAMYNKSVIYVMKRAIRVPNVTGSELKTFFKPYRKYLLFNKTASLPLKIVCLLASYGYICHPLVLKMK